MSSPGSDATKAEWRAWARAERDRLRAAGRSGAVVGHLRRWDDLHGTVLIYLPMPDEIDVTPLTSVAGLRCAVTRTPPVGPLTVHPIDVPMERHRYGFLQPTGDAGQIDPEEIDVALVPGLVFDRRGARLGRGAGYYDRLCSELRPDALRVGVTLDGLVFDAIPEDAHDVRMTHLATESGVVSV